MEDMSDKIRSHTLSYPSCISFYAELSRSWQGKG